MRNYFAFNRQFNSMRYRHISDFSNLTLAFGAPTELNFGYTAKPNFEIDNSQYFADDFFILFRRSEYSAQVECAMAEIYRNLTGYGPEVYVVTDDQGKFYAASRRIKNFHHSFAFFGNNPSYDKVENLAAMYVISYFFAESDMHSGQYGASITDDMIRMFKIDNAEALDFPSMVYGLSADILRQLPYTIAPSYDDLGALTIPKNIVLSDKFQKEKINMIQKIANTDFSVFEGILNRYLTRDLFSHVNKISEYINDMESMEEDEKFRFRNNVLQMDPDCYSHKALLDKLKARHIQLNQIVATETLSQDISLRDGKAYTALNAQRIQKSDVCMQIQNRMALT